MHVEIGAEAALFPEKEYINGMAVAVHISLPDRSAFFPGECDRSLKGNLNQSYNNDI
jgi:hypothetical protein